MPLPRGLEISYKANLDYPVHSTSTLLGPGRGEVEKNRIFTIKLKFPFLNKPKLKIAGGFMYSDEEFHFDDMPSNGYALYQSLNEKNLKSLGGALYFLMKGKNRSYFMLRMSGKFNGDYWKEHIGDVSQTNFLKFEIAPMMGWKLDPWKSWGVGVAFSYSFGEPLVFPVISYNHTFNSRWGIEALLPAKFKLRYQSSRLTYWNLIGKLSGGSYSIHMDAPGLNDFKTLELRQSEVDVSMNLEKGLNDWLWIEMAAGYRMNLKFDVTNNNNNRYTLSGKRISGKDYVIDSFVGGGAFLKIGMYITPSKSLIRKFGL
jgi:hypothetical protein